jgi:phenylacetic acid degradation protein
LAAGTPTKVIRELDDKEIEWKGQGTRDYQQLTRRCFESMAEVEPLTEIEEQRPTLAVSASIPLYLAKQEQD